MLTGHGGNINQICSTHGLDPNDIIDFSASINPLGYPDSVRKIILERFDDILNYPDSECVGLRRNIAEKHSCNEPNIIVGNGSNELFYLLPRALKPKQGVVLQPTFNEFNDALRNANVEVVDIINDNNKFPLVNINGPGLKGIKDGIVFLCNPNNPTGQIISKDQVLGFANSNPDRLIVVDEAFMDFVEEEEKYSVVREALSLNNLVVVRSLTKFYGFPGLRLGYLVACESIINTLLRYKEPWTVNALAQVAGQAAINDVQFAFNTKRFISKEKAYLYQELSEIKDLHPLYPSANFILISIENDGYTSSDIYDLLIKDNIVIRDCSNFVGMNNKYFRIAVRTREENQMLLSALREVMEYELVENDKSQKTNHE